MDVSLLGRTATEGQQMEAAVAPRRPRLRWSFRRACEWVLGQNILFAEDSFLGNPLLNKQVGLRRAMLWYSAAGAAAAVAAQVLAGRGSRRRTACRAAAFAALASAAFNHCVVCGLFARSLLTITHQGQGEPLLVLGLLGAAAAFLVVSYAVAVCDVRSFLAILRAARGDDGVAAGGEKEE